MPRLSVHSRRVRALVEDALIPLFLQSCSIAALCKQLNTALGGDRPLHPNRIHGLLSDDIGRGANEATIELIEQALAGIGDAWSAQSRAKLSEIGRRARPLLDVPGGDIAGAAKRLSLPRAVVRLALGEADERELDGRNAPRDPDWSFQDDAFARTVEAFARRPTGAVGLILPTGAGKSRTALRIALEQLARSADPEGRAIWATHRLGLKSQAARELAKLLADDTASLPPNARALAARIEFLMIGEVEAAIEAAPPVLVVVDEAHHAAAPSYQLLLQDGRPFPLLLLTATPNRSDGLAIGIDEIAYSITYAELARRGAIIIPEFIDLPVENFEWSPDALRNLADFVIDETDERFFKTLVLVSRVERVEEFHKALVDRLALEPGHRLHARDIGYVHGGGNSLGLDNEVFLERFRDKPKGIIVSAQILLEGYDDPAIDAVVMTYPSQSLIKLMQSAGRAVRHHRGKTAAYVVQAHNPDLAYRFDQRWLYQEIDDYLRPDLVDFDYSDQSALLAKVEEQLDRHNVPAPRRREVLAAIAAAPDERDWKLLFFGRPYYGPPDRFNEDAEWGVFLETPANRTIFRSLFNSFSAMGAHQSDPGLFLETMGPAAGLGTDAAGLALRDEMLDVLTACFFARDQIVAPGSPGLQGTRPFKRHGPTTWLRYMTFAARGAIPDALAAFLVGCHNRPAIERAYLAAPGEAAMAVKIPLPLGLYEAHLLDEVGTDAFVRWVGDAHLALMDVPAERQLAALAAHTAADLAPPLPMSLVMRLEQFLMPAPAVPLTLSLTISTPSQGSTE
jgi:superfamily II DNA or RNA helicase